MTDLFSAAQGTLFNTVPEDSPEKREARVRARLLALLDTASRAARMPWDHQKAEVNEIIFNQSSNWLPEAERTALRSRFAAEMARLRAAE
jgi:hypothetical protein